jgi:hypothetical protein
MRRTPKARSDWTGRGTAIGSFASVLLVAVGLYLTNDFNRDQLSQQRESTRGQQDVALKGQRADRFVTAVGQLGQEGTSKIGIRLGGIYALETLMKDSPEDENTVIEVLSAFVRTHAPAPKDKSLPAARVIPESAPPSPTDIRAAVSVLGRRPNPRDHAPVDLNFTLLGLQEMNLRGADLRSVNLTDPVFDLSQIVCARVDASTVMPAGATRPAEDVWKSPGCVHR